MGARITVSLPQTLVDQIDLYASRAGVSRSFVVREASAEYLTEAAGRYAAERRKRGTEGLLSFLEETSSVPAIDDRPVLEILRELRGSLGPAPEASDRGGKPTGRGST